MIYLYSGTPGSGKSLYSAYELIRWIKMGRTVIANFPINDEVFPKKVRKKMFFDFCPNERLTPQYLKSFAEVYHKLGKEHQTLVIIDECAIMFNSRDWDRKGRAEWITFFQQHRKLGFDIILIAQNDRLIDRQIRAFIETEYKFRAIKNYKTFGFLLSIFTGGMFMYVEYWYGPRLRCSSSFFRYNKHKAKIYNTYQIFE